MTVDIKKAWEQMKKDLKKETGISGGFTMNARQIKNRTATYSVCNNKTYDEEIAYFEKQCAKVQTYTSWTDEEKAGCAARTAETVKAIQERKNKYGTKENEARYYEELIVNSKAFKKFEEAVGEVKTNIETIENFVYTIRFFY